jgi:RNase H-like domain found in reverse transcriptase/Reverse transcriptase (RNA-dependent DNA polymerase)
MNDIFHDLLDDYIIVYIDDILIYSKMMESHYQHVEEVLKRLRQHRLYAKRSKCEFGVTQLSFLGHIVSAAGLQVDPSKVDTITKWPIPIQVKDIQSFLGLCNYYRRFIHQFAKVTVPLTRLLHKNVSWQWTSIEQTAFDSLKALLTEAPILRMPNPDNRFYLHIDASSTMAIAGILSQEQEDGYLHPVAYESKSLTTVEQHYPVHEQELLALKHCLDKWRHYLDAQPFTVYTDNQSLQTIQTHKNLLKWQIRWLEQLQLFQFDIFHIPRERNTGADALSK